MDASTSGFTCGEALPNVTFPAVMTADGTPADAEGGSLEEGTYVQTKVLIYGEFFNVPGDVFELRNGFVHHQHTTFGKDGSSLTGYERIGSYATTGSTIAMDVEPCGAGNSQAALWSFTAADRELTLFHREGDTTWVQTFLRQD